jgi:signal transduction histidine kinase
MTSSPSASRSTSRSDVGCRRAQGPDFLPHVFQPFRQAEANATTGLGLGLGIVKNLVELHGGTVAAESGGVGRGAQFTVTVPCAVFNS